MHIEPEFNKFLKAKYAGKTVGTHRVWWGTLESLFTLGITKESSQADVLAAADQMPAVKRIYIRDAWKAYAEFIEFQKTPPQEVVKDETPEHMLQFVAAVRDLSRIGQATFDEAKNLDAADLGLVSDTVLRIHFTTPQRIMHVSTLDAPALYAVCLESLSWSASLINEKIVPKVFPATVWQWCKHLRFRGPTDPPIFTVLRVRTLDMQWNECPLMESSLSLRSKLLTIKKEV